LQILAVTQSNDVSDLLLEEVRRGMPKDSRLDCVEDVGSARQILLNRKLDALLIDDALPSGGAAAFIRSTLRLGRRCPILFLIGTLTATDSEVVGLLRQKPEVRFIDRPFQADVAARRVLSALLPQFNKDQSLYGLRLCELIQAFCLSRRDSTLMVLLPDGRMGSVSIKAGRLVHAAFGDLEGMDALLAMVESRKGEIRVEPDCPTTRRTIEKPTQQVLTEVYRLLDGDPTPNPAGAPPLPAAAAALAQEPQILAELNSIILEDKEAGELPRAPSPKGSPGAGRQPKVKSRVFAKPPIQQIYATYRGIPPPQIFPPSPGTRVNGSPPPGGTPQKFLPKEVPPRSIEQMIDDALDGKE